MLSNEAKAWIRKRTVSQTARDLGVIPRTGFGWMQGTRIPRVRDAAGLICLAGSEGVQLTYSDIYGDPRQVAPPRLRDLTPRTKESRK